MTQDILNAIYEYYSDRNMNGVRRRNVPEVDEFRQEYIHPEITRDRKEGFKMEEMFNAALAEFATQEFIRGFQLCMHFMVECL